MGVYYEGMDDFYDSMPSDEDYYEGRLSEQIMNIETGLSSANIGRA